MLLSKYPNCWGFCPTIVFTRYNYVNFAVYPKMQSNTSVPLLVAPMYFQSDMSMICGFVLMSYLFSGSMAHVTFCCVLVLTTQFLLPCLNSHYTVSTAQWIHSRVAYACYKKSCLILIHGLFGWTDSVTGDTLRNQQRLSMDFLLQTAPQRSGLLSFVDLAGSERGGAKERHRCHCKQVFWGTSMDAAHSQMEVASTLIHSLYHPLQCLWNYYFWVVLLAKLQRLWVRQLPFHAEVSLSDPGLAQTSATGDRLKEAQHINRRRHNAPLI